MGVLTYLSNDQLAAQGGWGEALAAFVDDLVTYPAAILKGPVWEWRYASWAASWIGIGFSWTPT